MAKELAQKLELHYQSLDHLWFRPSWIEVTRSEFQESVRKVIQEYPNLILDGNFTRKLEGSLDGVLTDLLCKCRGNIKSSLQLSL